MSGNSSSLNLCFGDGQGQDRLSKGFFSNSELYLGSTVSLNGVTLIGKCIASVSTLLLGILILPFLWLFVHALMRYFLPDVD